MSVPGTPTPAPDYPEYANLWEQARRQARGPIDPRLPSTVERLSHARGPDWCTAVLGRYWTGARATTHTEAVMIVLADRAGIDPPLPKWIIDERADADAHLAYLEQARRNITDRDEEIWDEVRSRSSVAVDVYENTTARPRNGVAERLGHAVPRADVYSGTTNIRVHAAGRALCETAQRRQELALSDTRSDGPVTCIRCLHWMPLVRAAR